MDAVTEVANALERSLGKGMGSASGELAFRCPFHQDRSPSFYVNITKGVFNCFAGTCGERGTVAWLLRHLGHSVPEALEDDWRLGARRRGRRDKVRASGIRLPEALMNLLDPYTLPGFSQDTCARFEVSWDDKLKRVIFPIRDSEGGLVALSGRRAEDDPAIKRLGKYKVYKGELNDLMFEVPETPNHKQFLWGEHLLPDTCTEVTAVEGFKAAMAVAEAGFEDVVATMGTELTEEQVGRLSARADVVRILFDGDAGGRLAATNLYYKLDRRCLRTVIQLPKGLQPDDLPRPELARVLSNHEVNMRHRVPQGLKRRIAGRQRQQGTTQRAFVPAMDNGIKIRMVPIKADKDSEPDFLIEYCQAFLERLDGKDLNRYIRCFCPEGLPCPAHYKLGDKLARPDAVGMPPPGVLKLQRRFVIGVEVMENCHVIEEEVHGKSKPQRVCVPCKGKMRCAYCKDGLEVIKAGSLRLPWTLTVPHWEAIEEADVVELGKLCAHCGRELELLKAACSHCGHVLYEYSDELDSTRYLSAQKAARRLYLAGMRCSECGEESRPPEHTVQCFKEDGDEMVPCCEAPEPDTLLRYVFTVHQTATDKKKKWTNLAIGLNKKDTVEVTEPGDESAPDPIDVSRELPDFEYICGLMNVDREEVEKAYEGMSPSSVPPM